MSRAILDSSPMGTSTAASGAPQRRPLKRTASTASLLTPPQTIENKGRYTRSRSRGSDRDTDVEEDSEEESDRKSSKSIGRLQLGRKRQRTDRLEAVAAALTGEDAENPFWDGEIKRQSVVEDEQDEEDEDEADHRSPTPPVVRFRRNKAPVSPPPSRRRATVKTTVPTTPKAKSKARVVDGPVRDSGNNPFLDESPGSVMDDPSPKTPQDHEEKPTIAYVFRGVRTKFANPHYNVSPSTRQRALLPVEHPDYSPDPACAPKMLFPNARKRTRSASPTRKRAKIPARVSTSKHKTDDEWEDDEGHGLQLSPPKRLFPGP